MLQQMIGVITTFDRVMGPEAIYPVFSTGESWLEYIYNNDSVILMKSGTNKIVGHLNNIRKGDVIGIYMQDSISNFKLVKLWDHTDQTKMTRMTLAEHGLFNHNRCNNIGELLIDLTVKDIRLFKPFGNDSFIIRYDNSESAYGTIPPIKWYATKEVADRLRRNSIQELFEPSKWTGEMFVKTTSIAVSFEPMKTTIKFLHDSIGLSKVESLLRDEGYIKYHLSGVYEFHPLDKEQEVTYFSLREPDDSIVTVSYHYDTHQITLPFTVVYNG